MANAPKEDLQSNPAVRATDANRELNLKNFQARSRWTMLVKKIEKQKKEREQEITEEQDKLLKYRERLQNTSLSIASPEKDIEHGGQNTSEEKPKMTFYDVYRSLMESARKDKEAHEQNDNGDNNSIKNPRENIYSRGTASSEQKRVQRKRFSYSLNELQKANSSLQNKKEDIPQTEVEKTPEEESSTARGTRSLLDFTEDDEAIGPVRLPPRTLPKIYQQTGFKPRTRSFDKDDQFKKQVSGSNTKIEDLRYCRYLRTSAGTKRRNTAPSLNFGQLRRNANT